MSPTTWAMVAYAAAAVFALIFLFFSGTKAWYWHVLSGLAAIGLGLTPIPPKYNTSAINIVIGFVFVFMFLWAIAAPFVARRRRSA